MKFSGVRALFVLSVFPLWVFCVREVTAAEVGSNPLQLQFDEVKTRLAAIETQQQSILAQKDKILKEINQLCILVRHSGGKKKK